MYRIPVRAMGMLAGFSLASSAESAVLFVKPTPTSAGDCGSWADACALTDAINSAVSGDEVWVRAGVYDPIELKDGVKIIGGFAGNETSASQSNPVVNVTALDGGGTRRCVTSVNHSAATVLRGFTIRNGYNGYDVDEHGGGGMMLSDSSALIVQCTFEDNTDAILGGAVVVYTEFVPSYPQFINCIFRNNGSTSPDDPPYEGGAVFISYASEVTFTNCLFDGNKAGGGGGVAKVPGTFAYFTNCTMSNNQATFTRGGAIRDASGGVSLRNCILWGNTRIESGAPLADQIYSPGFDARVTYSDVEGGWPGTGNIDADPLFGDVAGGNFNLEFGSPCKDMGSNAYLPADVADLDWDGDALETVPYDLALRSRILGVAVDMGAYETPFCGDGNCDADENSCSCSQDCGPALQSEEPDSSCRDGNDNDCDTLTDCDDPDCGLEPACIGIVPTVSEWGLVILALLLLTAAKIYFGHQPGRKPTR